VRTLCEHTGSEVTAPRQGDRRSAERDAQRGDGHEHPRPRVRERLELLDPAERVAHAATRGPSPSPPPCAGRSDPRMPAAYALARRRVPNSWLVSTPTQRNRRDWPSRTVRRRAHRRHRCRHRGPPDQHHEGGEHHEEGTEPRREPPRACAQAPRRVVRPASSSSQRPASSSARTSRVAVSSPKTAPMTDSTMRHFHAVNPATVWISWAGPLRALIPAFVPKSPARRSREAGVL